ncbi:hypothetical protein [Microbacterium sp. NIBRBAC000506063]|uniref:hypothetical protein n=1 Tax=Microbacterium sp. NIBRBAC000506063 TaxID=2734618 RepID=UPI001BB4D28C|nr:hypothetical protein [Microbacterium sp. NIBRBAC000506063]QTV79920.1 hypothetical protein KAE78_01660 [Microbacterium sp. NIBRBAC000506063]
MLRLARLARARIRYRLHLLVFVPTVRATTWMYFAAAGLVGFGALEAWVVLFALSPSAFPLLLLGLALVAVTRDAGRRGIRRARLGIRRWRARTRRRRQPAAGDSIEMSAPQS